MTPEEIERTIQFIVKNHADSAVRLQITEENIRALTEEVRDLVDTSRYLVNTTEELVESNRAMKELMSILVPLVAANSKRINRLEEGG